MSPQREESKSLEMKEWIKVFLEDKVLIVVV